jgi:hypothetical protein
MEMTQAAARTEGICGNWLLCTRRASCGVRLRPLLMTVPFIESHPCWNKQSQREALRADLKVSNVFKSW